MPTLRNDVLVRPLADGDWSGVARLEADVYGPLGLSEGAEALASRARTSPGTCYVVESDAHTAGYLISLPYPPFRSPDLARTEETAFRSTNLHLHDLAVAERFRGAGLARRLLERLDATARSERYERISLIAVAGSAPFWSARGFHPHREVGLPASYGTDATYMSMPIPGRVPERRKG
ncbi:GNAT family N-acetyltransferase [Streptomyces sp. NPDC048172]|uniref:GNAT family N-acetyltransferase n=1 Tax=Streptomyces sp. NPDC048172 TaxID=3365505 RepID=UPI00371890A7